MRHCYKCGKLAGHGKRELRPYGPNGKDVCAGCMFGEGGREPDPAVREEAERQIMRRFMEPGPHILTPDGPVPLKRHKA